MIPMFRVLASGYSRITSSLPAPVPRPVTFSAVSATSTFSAGTAISDPPHGTPGSIRARPRCALRSPSVVRERAVRLRHLVHVLAPLDGDTLAVGGVHDLPDKALGHRMLLARAGVVDDPPHRERRPTRRPNLHRHLVVGAADPSRTHLELRTHVLDRLLERDDRIVGRALADDLERLVDGALRQRLLAVQQDLVDQLGDEDVLVDRIGLGFAMDGRTLARHVTPRPSWRRSASEPCAAP